MTRRIILVAGAPRQHHGEFPAHSLYQSPLFKKSLAWVKACGHNDWFVLSAKHHLLNPGDIVQPYDLTLRDLSSYERSQWAKKTRAQLMRVVEEKGGDVKFVVLAGKLYLDALEGLSYETPLKGMGIASQLSTLEMWTSYLKKAQEQP